MQLTKALYRGSPLFFLVFFGLALWGFWETYYSNPSQLSSVLLHIHGSAMTLWCVMLIAQSYLIKTNRRSLHRVVGRASFVLAPLNVGLQLAVLRQRIPTHESLLAGDQLTSEGLVAFASVIEPLMFGAIYGLAILCRKTPAIHGRLMLCTIFPAMTAVVDRIVLFNFPSVIPMLPKVAGAPFNPTVAFGVAIATLGALSVWDWNSHRRLNVFPAVLTMFLAYLAIAVTGYRMPIWRSFGEWFLGI